MSTVKASICQPALQDFAFVFFEDWTWSANASEANTQTNNLTSPGSMAK